MATFSNTPRPAYVYEAATDQWIPVGFGPHTHAVTDVTNAFNTTTVTAKGDLVVAAGSNSVTKLPVGSNGQTLVPDSSTTTGLRWQDTFVAGKNKIINGDFGVWQRGTSYTPTNSSTQYGSADRWMTFYNGSAVGTNTVSRQAFTPGQTAVPGNPTYFIRTATNASATQNATDYYQKVEDVSTFAGQTVTLSFWAQTSNSGTIALYIDQNFGSGGSTTVEATPTASSLTFTTTWARYTATFTLPSISGKTVGVGNFVGFRIRNFSTLTNGTFDLAQVQLEAGSVATPFTTASGSIGGELALCQRYYTTSIPTGFTITDFSGMNQGSSSAIGWCSPGSTNDIFTTIQYPVPMRAAPTFVIYSAGNRTAGSVRDAVTGSDIAVGNYSVQTGNNKGFNYMSGFTATAGRPYSFQWTANAEL